MARSPELDAIIERLRSQFPDVPPDDVAAVVDVASVTLSGRPIRSHLPVLVELEARQRLRDRAANSDRGAPQPARGGGTSAEQTAR